MKKLFILALASLFVLSACMQDEPESENIESVAQALDNPPEPADTSCHVPSPIGSTTGPIINGTKSNFWCCGQALCVDEEVCGDYYGEYVESCVDCHYSECIPGSEAKGGKGPVRIPVGVRATQLTPVR